MKNVILVFLPVLLFWPIFARGEENLGQRLSGRILLDVERKGEAWYVYPEDECRYFLGRPEDAFRLMREMGLGIAERDFGRLAQAGTAAEGDTALARRLAGMILLRVERYGEAWYINPSDLKRYYLGRPEDAFRLMRELGLGISRENLARVHKHGLREAVNRYSYYEHKAIETSAGNFTVDIVSIDLKNPKLKIITDTTMLHPSPLTGKEEGFYAAKSLGQFVLENKGFAAINGTYFCAYSSCEANNYYFFPVYNTKLGKMVNDDQLKYWTTGPLMAFDADNEFYYYEDSRDFPVRGWSPEIVGVADAFAQVNGARLQAAIGNKPRLVEDGMNQLIEWELDDKQRNVKAVRNAMGHKDGVIYLVIARDATVPDLAEIMKAMGADYALNLDGGYSAALWYNDEYMFGPGRNIPNAVIFAEE